MKKVIYVLILAAVIVAGYFAFRFFSGRETQSGNQIQSGLLPGPSTPSAPPADYSIASTFPKGETITIGTKDGNIEVRNFYKTIVDTEEGLLILKNTDEYEIAYDRGNSSFLLYLKNPSAKNSRKNAEGDFLQVLGINQESACKLTVQVSGSASSQFVENPNLSFCLSKVQ